MKIKTEPYDPLLDYIEWRISKNKNVILMINGSTGSGKSYAGLYLAEKLAKKLNSNFSVKNNVDFTFAGLLRKMDLPNNDKAGTIFLFEEAGSISSGSSFREWQSQANIMFNSFLQTARHLRQILIMTTPQFTYLDAASRRLIHLQLDMRKINYATKESVSVPSVLQVNNRTGQIYFKRLRYMEKEQRIRLDTYRAKLPTDDTIKEYEVIKTAFTTALRKRILGDDDQAKKPETSYKRVDAKYVGALANQGFTEKEISKALGVSLTSVQRKKKEFKGQI